MARTTKCRTARSCSRRIIPQTRTPTPASSRARCSSKFFKKLAVSPICSRDGRPGGANSACGMHRYGDPLAPVTAVPFFSDRNPSQPYKHRLRLQPNSPGLLDAALDFLFESDHISGFCVATIDEGEGVFAGDSYRARRIALNESRVLDQPGCRDFVLVFERRVAGNL